MRYVPSRSIAFTLVLVVLLAACATSTTFIVSGESLDAAGKAFVTVGNAYNKGLDAKTVTVEQYKAWAAFATKFKAGYPASVQLWKSAIAVNDTALTKKADAVIVSLVSEMAQLGTVVGIQLWGAK